MTDLLQDLIGELPDWLQQTIVAVIVAVFAVAVALFIHALLFRLLRRFAKASESDSDNLVVKRLARPSRWALVSLALVLAARETPALEAMWERIGGLVMPLMVGWMALAILNALVEAMVLRADISMADNRRNRRRRTRLTIFGRIATFVIVFLTIALMLLSIPGVRDIGVTLMASAGLAALAVGAAAQPALKALISGFQMALTEPVVIGDAVIVGGEWGWIEEIKTTYVVVKVWDERRLVVPTNKFLEEIFQNWTKTTSQLMGTILLYVDPATQLDPIREKFMEIVAANERWDGRVRHMQITELTRDAIEVRFLVTAKDSPTLFDLRCDVREALIQWLAAEMPEAIVRSRLLPVGPVETAPLGAPSGEAMAQMAAQ
ncbi:mechanosensitive ion channel family protein [Novosphingobium decolorationis]|uniref:Mechanosensitive ion channel n=1 Tax=Novosphingobium decolorationis TaxID=2698673 RepID=A0ABX8E783_9SPHN|nr:mechanosensitive ion channel domain-containing protein [Novosphingobium decolorationis]MED5543633.1 mechanosensitive ion channel domain-containing protein [Pseudomonadota bacterium]QVM84847.1 mechanosensitive ion channel [Novosphingobium decolorationis]